MTTGNKVITKTIADVTYVPLESVMTGSDSIPFVYLKNGTKQIVVLGESNENNVVVEQGIEPGTQIYLNSPEEPERFTKIAGTDLIAIIKQKEKEKKEAERRANMDAQRGLGGRPGTMEMTPEMMQQFQNMRGNMQQGQGRQMDTAAMRRFREMRGNMPQGGGPRDTAAMRRFINQNPPPVQQTQPAQQTQPTQQTPVNR
jgi:hypothetical protein